MNPKYETTGRSGGRPSADFASSGAPGRKRSRSTEFGTTVEPTPKTSPTSWLIAIDVVASRRIAARTNAERRSRPPSGSALRRCQTTGKPSRRASHAAGISGEPMLAAAMAVNVMHISESDGIGGSGRSAFRLHTSLRQMGHGSRMLVGRRRTDDLDVRLLKRSIAWRAGDRVAGTIADLLNLQYIFFPSSFGVVNDPWFKGADVVQLYNTHGSYFSHSALPVLSRRRPVVWRLSDMWAFTGHVAYSYDCERWRHGCGSCPYLTEYPALSRDTTAFLWRWKNEVYRRSKLTIVAPSRWIERAASQSPLPSRFPIRWIPNGVDLQRSRPVERAA